MSAAEDTSDARSRGEEGAGGFTHPGGTRCGRWRAGALRNREGKGEWTLGISRLGRAFAEETLVAILKKGPFVCREAGGGSDSRDGRWTRRRAWTHLDGRKKVVHFDSVALRRGTPLPAAPTAMSPLLAKSIFFVLCLCCAPPHVEGLRISRCSRPSPRGVDLSRAFRRRPSTAGLRFVLGVHSR